nr:MAG TPA: minor capsid protein [Caudoviricetes sp.]
MKRDEGRRLTDAELDALEKRIREMYGEAAKNLQQIIDAYFSDFRLRDDEMQKLIGTIVNGREWTEEDYKQWRLAQMGRGQRFEALRDKLAERLTNANEVAISYVNDATPGIYTLNRNYAAYEVSDAGGDFTIYDEQTVRRLIAENPDLMPYYPKAKAVRRGIDLEYGKKQITNAVTSGILMGSSTRRIAADLRRRIVDMEIESAIRAARTAVTAAENGGRQATYEKAAEMGIEMEREWIATKDHRTRKWHGIADGQRVGVDEPFTVGGEKLMFPGDTSHGASGWNIYNCRCSIRTQVKGHGRKRETYEEWLKRLQEEAAAVEDADDASALKFFGADARDDLNKIASGGIIHLENGFAAFPDGDPLAENIRAVKPLKTFFDVAMHGSPTAVGYGTLETNMSPRLLASVIRHMDGWNGQKIRLLSCSTGKQIGDEYCFAEELANALGVEIRAPNDTLFITKSGGIYVGAHREGKMETFYPNQRRRRK